MKKTKSAIGLANELPIFQSIGKLCWIIKLRLRSEEASTIKTLLIEATIWVWYQEPKLREMCQTLVNFMPNRVQQVIKKCNDHIMYQN